MRIETVRERINREIKESEGGIPEYLVTWLELHGIDMVEWLEQHERELALIESDVDMLTAMSAMFHLGYECAVESMHEQLEI